MDRFATGAKLLHMTSQLRAAAVAASLRRVAFAIKANFNPNQPRVPAGNPDGGQWTDAGGSGGGDSLTSDRRDRTETTDRPGAQDSSNYHIVQLREPNPDIIGIADTSIPGIVVERFDRTGNRIVDTMTEILLNRAALAHVMVGEGAGPLYGTNVHTAFAKAVRDQNLPGVEIEQSFSAGDTAKYGLDGTIRTDVIFRDKVSKVIAIWDLKTGRARLEPKRVREIRREVNVGPEVPVIELHIRRGVTNKRQLFGWPSTDEPQIAPIELCRRSLAWDPAPGGPSAEPRPGWRSGD